MPMSMLRLRPGVNVELTPSQLEAGYSASNLIRYRSGLAEKLGGWSRYYPFAVGGVPKCLHAWQDLNDNQYLGVGSTSILGTIIDGDLVNLTPQTLTSDFTPDFDTTMGSPNVVVDDPNIDTVTTYDSVEFLTPVSVDGIILSGVYPIDASLSTTTYRIVAASNGAAGVTAGGAVPEFTTTSGSAEVVVDFDDHGLSVGDTINFPIATTVGGVTIEGTYAAISVGSVDQFTIGASSVATSSTSAFMNGGEVRLVYYIALGPQPTASGYSVGGYSDGGYSTGSVSPAQTGTPITATDWSLDNWGQTLLANPEGGGIYTWQPNSGIINAQVLAPAPAKNNGMFVATEIQIAVAYGASEAQDIGIDQDPLLVKWCNQGDFTDWVISSTSQAGSRRLSTGSRIVGGMAAPQFNLLWTDIGLWSMSYIGFPEVFGFNPIGYGCGLIAKHAAVRQGANIYWMGFTNFFVLGGGAPQPIPCTVWDVVFQDLNTSIDPVTARPYSSRSAAWSNTPYNEVWWFYPRASTGATQPDAYVKLNTLTGEWDYGPLDRSCGIDQSLLGMPIAASSGGIVYQHETTNNADGQAINAYIESGWFPISDGNEIAFMDWVLPDMKWGLSGGSQNATILLTFESVNYPGDTPQTHGPFTVTQTTQYVNTRVRGRLARFRVESNDLNSFWRLGGIRFRWAPDGRLG